MTSDKKIDKTSVFADVLDEPEVVEALLESGMHCIGCPMSGGETIEEGAVAHGIDVDELVDKINKLRKKNKNE
jgi:hybrid cluster-associated redox disulfide protein